MRKQNIICVVENIRDVIAIESTQQFNGTYHVLGGIISPLDGIGPDQLNIDSLVQRIQTEQTEELILLYRPTFKAIQPFTIFRKNNQPSMQNNHHCSWNCFVENWNMPMK
jgi:recombination protein RecR